MFKAAEIVGSVEAKNYVLSAAVAMDTIERLYKNRSVERERGITTRAMSKQSKLNGDIDGQTATEIIAGSGALTKRARNSMRVRRRCFLIGLSAYSMFVVT